jgi:hypothetical protein
MRSLPFRLLLAIAAITALAGTASAREVSGQAAIVDGDTLWVGSREIRIYGIDAPETSQRCQLPKGTWDCSTAATNALVVSEVDQYGSIHPRASAGFAVWLKRRRPGWRAPHIDSWG